MRYIEKQAVIDEDFLWLFRGFDKAAFYLSSDYHIIELTPAAETLFGVTRKHALHKPILSLFSLLNLQISFSKKGNKPIVSVSAKGDINNLHKANKIYNLSWQVKSKIVSGRGKEGFIIYAKEQSDIEYLSQVYRVVTGQDNIPNGSVKDYAEDIKNYLEDIIANLPGNIYWLDKNCIYLGCNDNAARFAGLASRKEAVGLSYEDMERKAGWVVGHTASWKRDDMEVVATGKPKLNVEEKPVLLPDGKEVFYLTSRVPLFDKKKNVIGVLGYLLI